MPRIPDDEIDRLKREVSVQRLAESRGIELKPHGANLIGLCPFHPDTSPSFVVTPSRNLWHCLGACRTGGTAIDFVMTANGVSFRHAVQLLRADLPGTAPITKPVSRSVVRQLPAVVSPEHDDQALLGRVVAYYHATLKESPEAIAYLEKRGLKSAEMIDHFRLGYANRTLGYRLPSKSGKDGVALRERLIRLGVLRKSGHEHLAGSLIVPVMGEENRVTEIYGRKIGERLRGGTPLHLYLPGPHRGVFNAAALADCEEVILCEALLDALTFWCAGFHNVTTSYGVEGFTPDHLAAFERWGTRRVLIAYDRDDAGDEAARVLAKKLLAKDIGCWRVELPRGMDVNEYAAKVQPPSRSLGIALRQARWMGAGEPPVRVLAEPVTTEVCEVTEKAAKEERAEESFPPSVASEPPRPAAPPESAEAPPPEPPPVRPRSSVPAEVRPEEVVIRLGDRRYRVRGLSRNAGFAELRVNLLCARGDGFHVDTLDLYSAKHRLGYLKQAAAELRVEEDVIKRDLGKVLCKLEEIQEAQIAQQLAAKEKDKTVVLSDPEKAAALELLRDPHLIDRILSDFERCGVVGECTSKLVGYLGAVSRKLSEPLAIIIQSASAAGKTSLMEAILAFMPSEERVKYSAMTGQSLFYMGETDLKHKILAIVEEAGAEKASYALKLLQSEGELTIASTGKDPTTGRLVTHEYRVEGPVMIILTTTAVDIDEELANRCIVLSVSEDREQTRAIHRLQRERQTLEGLLAGQDRERILKVHRDAQRLLRPLLVANPYAPKLSFLDDRTRTRRDHMKYLSLIRTIALLHQYQRPLHTVTHHGRAVQYLEVQPSDIALAGELAHEVLGRSLDELAPQTRRLLMLLDEIVGTEAQRLEMDLCEVRFTRRQVREHTGWGNTQLKVHLGRLVELEYLAVHRGPQGFVYELLYDGQGKDGTPFLIGLIDPKTLGYDAQRSGQTGGRSGGNRQRSGTGRPPVGPRSGGGRGAQNRGNGSDPSSMHASARPTAENAHLDP